MHQPFLALIITSLPSAASLSRNRAVAAVSWSSGPWCPALASEMGLCIPQSHSEKPGLAPEQSCASLSLPSSPSRWRSPCSAFRTGSAMPCTHPSRVWRTKWVASPAGRPSSPPWASGWTPQPVACQQLSSSQPPTQATGCSSAAVPSSPCWVSLGRAGPEGLADCLGRGVGDRGLCTHQDAGSHSWEGECLEKWPSPRHRLLI